MVVQSGDYTTCERLKVRSVCNINPASQKLPTPEVRKGGVKKSCRSDIIVLVAIRLFESGIRLISIPSNKRTSKKLTEKCISDNFGRQYGQKNLYNAGFGFMLISERNT